MEVHAAIDEDDTFVVVSHEETRDVKGKGKDISIFDETLDPLQMDIQPAPPAPEVVLSPPPPVRQSPFKIRTLSPGNRVHVFAILQGNTVPKTVTLIGLTEDGSEIKLSVPVTLSRLPNAPDSPPAIHALAARKIIQDIEDGQHAIHTAIPNDADLLARTVKAYIVRLAKTYSISSSQTSFVAVDESGTRQHPQLVSRTPVREDMKHAWKSMSHGFKGLKKSRVARRGVSYDRAASVSNSRPLIAIKSIAEDERTLASFIPKESEVPRDVKLSRQKAPPLKSTETWVAPESWVVSATEPKESEQVDSLNPAVPLESTALHHGTTRTAKSESSRHNKGKTVDPSPPDPLETLARLQSFNGCFAPRVLSTVQLNVSPDEARAVLGVSEDVFATLIAMAFLCTKLGPDVERESWEAMYDKARAYVEDALQAGTSTVGVDELQAQAVAYLA
ncbi:hypothetical protein B0H12DRAFT_364635 [Mycena haematopus]|nr:hypothetical protein B0H12DRAFT_364635 [Mycena haematopus]